MIYEKDKYNNVHSSVYDILYQHFSERLTSREIGLIKKIITEHKQHKSTSVFLDVACGTGRHLLPLCKSGHRVDGLDASMDMLSTLTKKAVSQNIPLYKLIATDIHRYNPGKRYDGVFCFFNAFGEIAKSVEDGIRVLSLIRSFLQPNGWLLIDMENPRRNFTHWKKYIEEKKNDVRVREYNHLTYNDIEGLLLMRNKLNVYKGNKLVKSLNPTYTTKFWSADELKLLFMICGFKKVRIVGDLYSLKNQPTSSLRFMVVGTRS